jgi:DNA-binding beta-propeller fold protein YncE
MVADQKSREIIEQVTKKVYIKNMTTCGPTKLTFLRKSPATRFGCFVYGGKIVKKTLNQPTLRTTLKATLKATLITLLKILIVFPALTVWAVNRLPSKDSSEPPLQCESEKATAALKVGFALQKDHNTEAALEKYKKCLEIEPNCVACLYESGWSLWKKGEWQQVIVQWELGLAKNPHHPLIPQFLPTAKENLKIVEAKNKVEVYRAKTDILIQSEPKDAPIVINFIGRRQAYNPSPSSPLDHFDTDIDSPKSAAFSPDGSLIYVNSLEGAKTVVFKSLGLEKVTAISHDFKGTESFFEKKAPFDYSFPPKNLNPNRFVGKPVESVLTHQGKFLWVTYYRRSYDELGRWPSAMALIDTKTNSIVRVFGTGPIAKYIQVSPDNLTLAVSNWGDNTVGLYDISGDDPKKFKPLKNLIVQAKMSPKEMVGNRDKNCGFCVRGLAFSKESRYLFVARMRKGGIAIFDLKDRTKPLYLGSVFGIHPGTRDLQMSPDGQFLYSGCNSSGYIAKVPVLKLIDLVKQPKGRNNRDGKGELRNESKNERENRFENMTLSWKENEIGMSRVFAGLGVRSMKVSADGKYLFAAVNQGSELQVYDTLAMKRIATIPVDSYPVGLAMSPAGTQIWVTSQGRGLKGGNSVGIFQVEYKAVENLSISKDPRLSRE